MYVVDSSVFASIIVKDEFYSRAISFIKKYSKLNLITIDLVFVEVANTLWKHACLMKRIPLKSYSILRDNIKSLIVNSVSKIFKSTDILEDAIDNALKLNITVYDSLYVTLALNKKYKVASFDEELKRKLKQKGLDIIIMP